MPRSCIHIALSVRCSPNAVADCVVPTGKYRATPSDSRSTPAKGAWTVRDIVGFIAGAIVGFGIGVASAIVYSGQTDKDLREVYAGVRENVKSVDLEQFGQEVQANVAQAQAQVQTNVAQVQAQVGDKVAQVRGKSDGNGTVTDEAAAEAGLE